MIEVEPCRRLTIKEYAERYVVLPSSYTPPGKFKVGPSRYLEAVWEALQDPEVREVSVMKPTQSGGSMIGDIWLAWLLRVAPAPMFMNMQTNEDAGDHAELRINDLLNNTGPVMDILPVGHKGKFKRVTQEITMQSMWWIMQGANISNLQSKSVCYEINDEIVFWTPDSLIRDARARQIAFGWRKKTYNVSQGGMVGDEHDRGYKAGTMEEWSWICPKCEFPQPYRWTYNNNPKEKGGLKWERKEGNSYEELADTIRLECRECGHSMRDTPKDRLILQEGGHYIQQNFSAPKTQRSFHWHCLAVDAMPWADLVWEWTEEVVPEFQSGNREPLQKFIQKKFAESDDEGVNYFDVQTVENSDYMLDAEGVMPPWDEEEFRFMAIDKQIDHYWWVVRAFSKIGTSRLVACGRAETDVELEELRLKFKVEYRYTALDSGKWAVECYMLCCTYGWRTLKGDDDKSFAWKDPATKEVVWKPYSPPIKREPLFGLRNQDLSKDEVREFQGRRKYRNAILSRWSNRSIKDLLQNLRTGMGLYWGVPGNAPQVYLDHLNGEQRRLKVDKRGKKSWEWVKVGRKGDHMRDCECMILVLAAIRGLLMGRSK